MLHSITYFFEESNPAVPTCLSSGSCGLHVHIYMYTMCCYSLKVWENPLYHKLFVSMETDIISIVM